MCTLRGADTVDSAGGFVICEIPSSSNISSSSDRCIWCQPREDVSETVMAQRASKVADGGGTEARNECGLDVVNIE